MPDAFLAGFLNAAYVLEEKVIETAISAGDDLEAVDVACPAVTVIVSGLILTGHPVTYRTYKKRLRQLVESAAPSPAAPSPAAERLGSTFLEALLGGFDAFSDALEGAGEAQLKIKQLFLVDAVALVQDQPVRLPPLSIPLEAVQGWTLGEIGA